jgi:RNA polymerase sigma-70 factor (ECF subfamily)
MSGDEQAPGGKLLSLRRISGDAAELTDAALVAGCAIDDSAALSALFDRHSRAVYRFISRLSGIGPGDLDDLVAVTFLEACRSAGKFRGGSAVTTWLFGIAVNVVRHHIRGDVRRRAFIAAYQHLPGVTSGHRPDDAAERRELVSRLDVAIQSLPQNLREAFVLCELEEVPGPDAARTLGVPQGTLWRWLHEARKALRSALT